MDIELSIATMVIELCIATMDINVCQWHSFASLVYIYFYPNSRNNKNKINK
jgi:hypothetical protein